MASRGGPFRSLGPVALGLVALVVVGCGSDADDASPGTGGGGGGGGEHSGGGSASSSSAGGSSGEAGTGGAGGAQVEPDFDAIPWKTGDTIGFGIATKDTQNPLGDDVFVGFGGYDISLASSQAWVEALYRAALRERGVRHVFAVQGPADPSYSGFEIGNSKTAASIVATLGPGARVIVAAHSSGSFVAHELLGQLAGSFDPSMITRGRIVYFNLDGGQSGLTPAIVDHLARAVFVAAHDPSTGTSSPNQSTMASLGAMYAANGGYLSMDGATAGCATGASWCLHMVPITTRPHDPTGAAGALDYADFEDRSVATSYLDELP